MRIILAQKNFIVGDVNHNIELIKQSALDNPNADLIVFSELCICGYPPEDLLLKQAFINECMNAVEELARHTENTPALLIGSPYMENNTLYNAAFLLDGGRIHTKQYKHILPNYSVFDEKRWFTAGELPEIIEFKGKKIGLFICEDMWDEAIYPHFKEANILLSINASPYDLDKHERRHDQVNTALHGQSKPIYYVNQIGGQDGLVFDGGSFIFDGEEYISEPLFWREGYVSIDTTISNENKTPHHHIYNALVLGLKDYMGKNGFAKALIGLSGGIDSVLTAAIAVDALGSENVKTVMMPSRYTSQESLDDARETAQLLGVEHKEIDIEPAYKIMLETLSSEFVDEKTEITEENLQARIRGVLLMAMSNKFNSLLLATGNKSELAVGYCTLYGDMCGGYAVLGDVYKTDVFRLSHFRNENHCEHWLGENGRVIPENAITKAPTAELNDNQKDTDSLPEYDVLDSILTQLIEQQKSPQEVEGFDTALVEKIAKMLYRTEYKRRQAPPITKITTMQFNKERRYPITNGS